MALSEAALVDTSVLTRLATPAVFAEVEEAMRARQLHLCAVARLALLRTTQSRRSWSAGRAALDGMPELAITPSHWERAEEVQSQLVGASHHTAVPVPDLLVAAVAESARLPVVHYDRGFDLIAEVTRQDCRWVVPRGSID
ncbi:MAG: PIN domain-containing protein [Acidimicrobiia bacterium]